MLVSKGAGPPTLAGLCSSNDRNGAWEPGAPGMPAAPSGRPGTMNPRGADFPSQASLYRIGVVPPPHLFMLFLISSSGRNGFICKQVDLGTFEPQVASAMLFAHITPSLPSQDIPFISHLSLHRTGKLISFHCRSASPGPAAYSAALPQSPEHLFTGPGLS